MEHIYYLCPATQEGYLHMLREIGPRLDDAGICFHICRPGEDIAGQILHDREVNV